MNERDKELVPSQEGQGVEEWDIEPTLSPLEHGFPEKPTLAESKRWPAQERFLMEFARTGLLCHSADVAGITPQAVEHWRNGGEYGKERTLNTFNFPKRFELALARYNERLDAEIDRRGIEGVDKPLVFRGQITRDGNGNPVTIKEYSDNLLMFKKKKLDPAYRDNFQPQQPNTHVAITQTVIEVHDYRNQGAVVEGRSRELAEEDKSEGGPGADSIEAEVKELGETEHN